MLALSAACAAFTVAVDPYRMYGTMPLTGWTALKPRIFEQGAIAKTYQLQRIRPITLLLGNSRVQVGFDPDSPLWPQNARPVFNAGLAGVGMEMSAALLREAIAVGPPRSVFLALDLQDFLRPPIPADTPLPAPGADERRLLVGRDGKPNPDRAMQIWRDRIATALSLDALEDSVMTLSSQDAAGGITLTPAGFEPKRDYEQYVAQNGFHGLFAQKNVAYDRQYRQYPHPNFADVSSNAGFRVLDNIIRLAAQHDITLTLFIHPYHADFLEMLHRVGLWDSFEGWKRALVRVTAGATGTLQLFDFSDYDAISTERVPPAGDRRTEMRWYWEAGHYRSALGQHVLAAMLDANGSDRLLMPATVECRLAAIRMAREAYVAGKHEPRRSLRTEDKPAQ